METCTLVISGIQIDSHQFAKLAVSLVALWNLALFFGARLPIVRDVINSYSQKIATGTGHSLARAQPLLLATVLGIILPSLALWLIAQVECNWNIAGVGGSVLIFCASMLTICVLSNAVRNSKVYYFTICCALIISATIVTPFIAGALLPSLESSAEALSDFGILLTDEMRALLPNLRVAVVSALGGHLGASSVDWNTPVLLINKVMIVDRPRLDWTPTLWHEVSHMVNEDVIAGRWLYTFVTVVAVAVAVFQSTKPDTDFVARVRTMHITTFAALAGALVIALSRHQSELRADSFATSRVGSPVMCESYLESVKGMRTHFIGALLYPSDTARLRLICEQR